MTLGLVITTLVNEELEQSDGAHHETKQRLVTAQ